MFDLSKINCPKVAVDAVIQLEDGKNLVFIKRSFEPLGLALTGGFVDYGESVKDAIKREVKEETNLDFDIQEQLIVRSDPDRDPRGHIITIPFWGIGHGTPKSGDDAKGLVKISIDYIEKHLGTLKFAFPDHINIVQDYLVRK